MWTIELPTEQKSEIADLIAELEADNHSRAAAVRFYETVAAELLPDDPPSISLALEESHYARDKHAIFLNYDEPGTVVGVGWSTWTERMTAAFWHELAHAMHSRQLEESEDPFLAEAFNLLEDIRIERRMVDELGQRAQTWLRFNVLGNKADFAIANQAEEQGWTAIASTFAGRQLARTVTRDDLKVLIDAFPAVEDEIEALTPIWSEYVALGDDELAIDQTEPLARALFERTLD